MACSDYYRSARLCVPPRRRTRFTSICTPVVCSHFFYYYFILLLLRLILNKLLTGIISIVDGVCPWLVNIIVLYDMC